MNFNNRKNLLLFSLAAETFLGSYGLLLGEQTAIVSILYLDRISFLRFRYSVITKGDTSLFPGVKKRFLSEMAFVRIDARIGVLHIAVLDGSYSTGSGFRRYAADYKSDERKVFEGRMETRI